jgi:hypothetical protein
MVRHLLTSTNFQPESSNDDGDGVSPNLPVTQMDLTGNNDYHDSDSNSDDDSTSRCNPNRTEQSSQSQLSLTNGSPTDIISDIAHAEEGIPEGTTLVNAPTPEPSNPFPDVHVPKPPSEETGNLPIVNPSPLLQKQFNKEKSAPKKTKSTTNGKTSDRRTSTPGKSSVPVIASVSVSKGIEIKLIMICV